MTKEREKKGVVVRRFMGCGTLDVVDAGVTTPLNITDGPGGT
jgi:hypothetical protein